MIVDFDRYYCCVVCNGFGSSWYDFWYIFVVVSVCIVVYLCNCLNFLDVDDLIDFFYDGFRRRVDMY